MPDPAVANEITAERLRAVTETTLAAKGYRQVADPAAADLLVTYTIMMFPETDLELNSSGIGCAPPICGGLSGYDYSLDSSHHTRGTLVLDLIERQTGRLVWRAISDKRVKARTPRQEKLTAAPPPDDQVAAAVAILRIPFSQHQTKERARYSTHSQLRLPEF